MKRAVGDEPIAIAMIRALSIGLFIATLAGAPQVARAQTSMFAGTVMVDPTEKPLANAEIVFPALNRTVRSDSAGNFVVTGLPAGKYSVTVRMLGYDPFTTQVTIGASQKISVDMMLRPSPQASTAQLLAADIMQNGGSTQRLAAVSVSEDAPGPYASKLAEFNDRRKSGAGRFITGEEFAKDNGRSTSAIVIKGISGIRIQQVNGRKYIVTGRQGELRMNGTVMKGSKNPAVDASSLDQPRGCYAQVIVNGIMRYNGMSGQPLFDIDQLEPKDIVGFEFHTAATLPAQYNMTQSPDAGACGTAIIWTKGG